MAVHVGENISFFMGPKMEGTSLSGLDDLEEVIVDFIDAAEDRLEIAVQELESLQITEAILRARIERGVKVAIVLEADYLKAQRRPDTVEDAFDPSGGHEVNRALAAAILRANIWARTDYNPAIFHQKFIIRDREAVLTGSTNFTPTGVGKSPLGGNLNHVLTVNSKDLARIYYREFREIRQGKFGKNVGDRNEQPDVVTLDGVEMKVCFAPDHNPELEIVKRINKARERIDFAIFTFAESSGIDDAVKLAMLAGVKVRGAMDGMQANQKWAASKHLVGDEAELFRVFPKKGFINKLHHKLLTVDDKEMVIGSFNYTGPANKTNDENIIVLSGEGAKPMVEAARAEIDRIIDDHGVPLTS
ncbi:MAG: phospholipase D-like domain-containing protein [Pseudomonadota bacterium]